MHRKYTNLTCGHRDHKLDEVILISNPKAKKKYLPGAFELYNLHREVICINISPTYGYLEAAAIDEKTETCYIETIKDNEVQITMNTENKKSKYAKIISSYDAFQQEIIVMQNQSHCASSCSLCCNDVFYITLQEFLTIMAFYIKEKKVHRLLGIYKKAKIQSKYIAENYKGVHLEINSNYDIKDPRFFNILMNINLKETCPFLNRLGKCDCYDARPIICREYGNTTTCMIISNPQNPIANRILDNVAIMSDGINIFLKKPRPIYFFIEKYLSPGKISSTFNLVKSFVEDNEEDFTKKVLDEEWIQI